MENGERGSRSTQILEQVAGPLPAEFGDMGAIADDSRVLDAEGNPL